MSNIKIFDYQGSPIQFEEVEGKIMANATLMGKPFNKSFNDWHKTNKAKKYILAISKKFDLNENELVVIRNGGSEIGSWIHEKLILRYAQYLDTDFEVWCDEKIAELLRTGKVELKPMTQMQMLQQVVNTMVEQEQSILELKNDVNEIKRIQEEAKNKISFVERSEEKMPELSVRDKVRKLVNVYAAAKFLDVNDVYNIVYNALYYRYHIMIKKYTRKKGESYLSVAERNNFIDKVFIVASNELVI